jgi:hypothetical protein
MLESLHQMHIKFIKVGEELVQYIGEMTKCAHNRFYRDFERKKTILK